MINPLIKEQLDKITKIELPNFDDERIISIKKTGSYSDSYFNVGDCYLICVEDYILNPPNGFTLHSNWNSNKIPKHKFMKIDVLQTMGKMVRVNSIGYDFKNHIDTGDMWEGWLPKKSITIVEKL